jgi:hypothetical protein
MKTIVKIAAIWLILAGSFSCGEENVRSVSCEQTPDYPEIHNENLCADPLCVEYINIWKEIFMQRNNLNEEYFDSHIELNQTSVDDWIEGSSISIAYYIKTDWAVACNVDRFIIKIQEGNTLYPTLIVPRGVFLTKDDIIKVIDMNAFSSEIIKLTPDETLKFKTMEDAMSFLIRQSSVNTLCFSRIYVDRATGHLKLEAGAQDEAEVNKCINATLDLINNETNTADGPCFISNLQ